MDCSWSIFRPSRVCFFLMPTPRLAPWAAFFRRFAASNRNSSDEQLPAMGCCSIASRIVGLCSTARRKRNHVVSGMRRGGGGGGGGGGGKKKPEAPPSRARGGGRGTPPR